VLERIRAALAARYAVEQEIGAGGMATVYLARDLKPPRRRALTVLRPALAATLCGDGCFGEVGVAGRRFCFTNNDRTSDIYMADLQTLK
jgi:serine/threonine-protein kinase